MVSETARSPAEVDAEAAAWLARLQGPHRSRGTDAALKAWLKADPSHEAAFERATEIWELLPGLDLAAEPAPPPAEPRRPRRLVLAAALATLLLALAVGGHAWLGRPPVYETAVGGQQVAMLDDGSRVSLNTDSRIAILYTDGERRVRLERGEAMFEVAHDAARPFIVESGDEQVRALGTVFVVRRDGETRLAVTLVEGRVEVTGHRGSAPARIAVLTPGQRVTVTPAAGAALDRPTLEAATAWRRGEIVFEDATLLEAVQELNRYTDEHLVVADPALASLRLSGVFSTGDIEEAARAIAALHHLRARREGGEIRLTRD